MNLLWTGQSLKAIIKLKIRLINAKQSLYTLLSPGQRGLSSHHAGAHVEEVPLQLLWVHQCFDSPVSVQYHLWWIHDGHRDLTPHWAVWLSSASLQTHLYISRWWHYPYKYWKQLSSITHLFVHSDVCILMLYICYVLASITDGG